MKKLHSIDEIAGIHLGKTSAGSESYDASLLVAVPRQENRSQYNIDEYNLPFDGWDVWHAYEFSCMTDSGIPVNRVIKLKYRCKSKYIVESKSLKLYLNSFNMTRFGANVNECLNICQELIVNDLCRILETDVKVNFIDNESERSALFNDYKNIMQFVDERGLKIEKFKEAPECIRVENAGEYLSYKLKFDSLRSNCRVTHQPDFGDAYIYYRSNKHILEDSLVKYLTSFRKEYHFHEECCEMIYKRLHDLLDVEDELFVCVLYTRRGGIDICPARWSKNCKIKDALNLLNIQTYAKPGVKQ